MVTAFRYHKYVNVEYFPQVFLAAFLTMSKSRLLQPFHYELRSVKDAFSHPRNAFTDKSTVNAELN